MTANRVQGDVQARWLAMQLARAQEEAQPGANTGAAELAGSPMTAEAALLAQVIAMNPELAMAAIGSTGSRSAPLVGSARPGGTLRAGDMLRDAQAVSARRANVAASGGVRVEVPFISQYDRRVPRAGDTACYRAVQVMGREAGVRVPDSTANRIQVATGEDRYGRVQTTPERVQRAREYIDSQLDAGRPVVAGVSHRDSNINRDRITDHFVMITGRGVDEQGRTFYTYNDPSTTSAARGRDNRFYVDAESGNLVHEGSRASGYVINRHTELSMVVPTT